MDSPEPAAIRALKKLSEAIGVDALKTDLCTILPRVEDRMARELRTALAEKDYDKLARLAGELSITARMKLELCK